VIELVTSLAVLAAIASPLVVAAFLAWTPSADALPTLVRGCGVATLIVVGFYEVVQGIVEPGARIDGSPSERLEFALGAVVVTLAVALVGAGLAALVVTTQPRLGSEGVGRVTATSVAALWLAAIYFGFVVTSFEAGFDICLPPATDAGGSCETSPG
jgi:hypothetical protein